MVSKCNTLPFDNMKLLQDFSQLALSAILGVLFTGAVFAPVSGSLAHPSGAAVQASRNLQGSSTEFDLKNLIVAFELADPAENRVKVEVFYDIEVIQNPLTDFSENIFHNEFGTFIEGSARGFVNDVEQDFQFNDIGVAERFIFANLTQAFGDPEEFVSLRFEFFVEQLICTSKSIV